MQDDNKLKDYDSEPVEYCARCYSLAIKHEDSIDSDCCSECGCTEIKTTSIENWERLYQQRYGHKFIERSKDPRQSPYFKMSIRNMKVRLSKSPLLFKVYRDLYHKVPKGYSDVELTIILFDKLSKDGRIDDLRYELYLYANKDNF